MTVRKFLRAIFTPNLCLVGIVMGVLAFVLAATPLAHAATVPAKPPQPKAPTVKLYIYPKLLPPQKGEVIIRDPSRPQVDTKQWA